MGWIPLAVLAIFMTSVSIIMLDIRYLYLHDIGRLRLKRVQDLIKLHGPNRSLVFDNKVRPWALFERHSLSGDGGGDDDDQLLAGGGLDFKKRAATSKQNRWTMNLAQYEQVLTEEIAETLHTLSYLGDKFIHMGVYAECVYILIICLALIIYFTFQWMFLFVNKPDIQYHRDLIDYPREQRRVDACCRKEALKYLESNRVHASATGPATCETCTADNQTPPIAGHLLLAAAKDGGIKSFRREQEKEKGRQVRRANDLDLRVKHYLFENRTRENKSRHDPKFSTPTPTSCSIQYRHRATRRHELAPPPADDNQASDHRARLMLIQMLACGALRPLNRSNEWIERRGRIQFAMLINLLVYCFIFDTVLLILPYREARRVFDLSELSGYILAPMIYFGITQHATTLILTCLEQVMLMNKIISLINDCINLNELEFVRYISWSSLCARCRWEHNLRQATHTIHHWTTRTRSQEEIIDNLPAHLLERQQQPPPPPPPPLQTPEDDSVGRAMIDKMNSNYLFVLMTYKIFIAQFASFRNTLRGAFVITISVAFIVPVLTRIHVPYLEQSNEQAGGHNVHRLRVLAILSGAAVLVPINGVCAPLCHVHSCGQRLYKALSSLKAHSAGVRQHTIGARLYNEHAVIILTKVLSDPTRMLEQFVTRSLGLGTTYATLVRLHFYWGLVALSALLDTLNGGAIFGSLISDPFSVWNFSLAPAGDDNNCNY